MDEAVALTMAWRHVHPPAIWVAGKMIEAHEAGEGIRSLMRLACALGPSHEHLPEMTCTAA